MELPWIRRYSSHYRNVSVLVTATFKKFADDRPKGVHINEKRIVTAYAVQLDKLRVVADRRNSCGQLALLRKWKQNVGAYPDNE